MSKPNVVKFEALYKGLEGPIKRLEDKFLSSHLVNTVSDPETFRDDVKAYCVLSHALFEDFFEQIAVAVMEESITMWYSADRKITFPLLALVSHANWKLSLDEDKNAGYKRIFDRVKSVIDELKRQFSQEIEGNHGIGLKYLMRILLPVGIDIPEDPDLRSSLALLSKARGDYAHGRDRDDIAPERVREYVGDCLRLSSKIMCRATESVYEVEYKAVLIQRLASVLNARISWPKIYL